MPLFYQHNINGNTRLGIWEIRESEDFFKQRVPLKSDVTHPHKRLQHLAGRYLLPALFPDFPLEEIVIADTRRPFLEKEQYHFSISHCGHYAAAIVSTENRVGIDLELILPKIERIRHKFLSPEEYALAEEGWKAVSLDISAEIFPYRLQTMLWSAKEALYKWYGAGLVDFRKHMWLSAGIGGLGDEWLDLPFIFEKNEQRRLIVHARFFDGLVLAWVIS